MIDPSTLTDDDKGRNVIYTSDQADGTTLTESGVLTSWNENYIFVRFNRHPAGVYPENVRFESPS